MIKKLIKLPFRLVKSRLTNYRNEQFIRQRLQQFPNKPSFFQFEEFKGRVLKFVSSLRTDESGVRYRYSENCETPVLYASAYACMTLSILNELHKLDPEKKTQWKDYFDSFQNENDGLFYDPAVQNIHFNDSDWWGARHLALHMISAYTDLGLKPKYPFRFLERFYEESYLNEWLQSHRHAFNGKMTSDVDNQLMNIGCLLQYQRDFFGDQKAGEALNRIQKYLKTIVNLNTGMWGDDNVSSADARSRKVQFAYHLLPLFFYDNDYSFNLQKLEKHAFDTQNRFGGFGVACNSSACEDIDSIDILVRIAEKTAQRKPIYESLSKGFSWVLCNQVEDGGFVFRLNESFEYGHPEMSSLKNQGAIFPTWFRTLSIAYLCRYLQIPHDFKITRCPGYEF